MAPVADLVEFLFEGHLGLLCFSEGLGLILDEFEAGGVVVGAADGGDSAGEGAEGSSIVPAGRKGRPGLGSGIGAGRRVRGIVSRRGSGSGEVGEEVGDVNGEEAGGMIGHFGGGGRLDGVGVIGERGEFFEEILTGLPLDESAVAPVAEVLLADGFAVEGLAEDGFDGSDAVEPLDESPGGNGTLQPAVEFLRDFRGDFGDFGDAAHGFEDLRFKILDGGFRARGMRAGITAGNNGVACPMVFLRGDVRRGRGWGRGVVPVGPA